jgi:ketose-bisphosphate aldolase
MAAALEGKYAVGYFESWNFESLQGVIDAAEESRSPMIIGFNGEFMSSDKRTAKERIAWYGALGKAAAESAGVPCAFIFNECTRDAWVRQAITAGFNLVMPIPAEGEAVEEDGPSYAARTRALVELAHAHGVAVEGELGELPFGAEGGGALTSPEQAARFVDETGVDLLAISAGNVHVLLQGRKALDLERVRQLRAAVETPLVLHGGTGIDGESLQSAIALGIAKVNFGTYLKQHYLAAVRRALASTEPNPHRLLGMGEHDDVMVAGRMAVRDAVLARIDLLGCRGKAVDHG